MGSHRDKPGRNNGFSPTATQKTHPHKRRLVGGSPQRTRTRRSTQHAHTTYQSRWRRSGQRRRGTTEGRCGRGAGVLSYDAVCGGQVGFIVVNSDWPAAAIPVEWARACAPSWPTEGAAFRGRYKQMNEDMQSLGPRHPTPAIRVPVTEFSAVNLRTAQHLNRYTTPATLPQPEPPLPEAAAAHPQVALQLQPLELHGVRLLPPDSEDRPHVPGPHHTCSTGVSR